MSNLIQLELAKSLQKTLTDAGFKTMAVGGFVRDYLLGRKWSDIDLATQALPSEVIKLFMTRGIDTYETGLKHGTVTAVLKGFNFEVTTLRLDKKCDGRHAEVEFTKSFEEDAKRRDFTINAMYMDLETMQLYDFVNGKQDIDDKILRFVGNPIDRIKEDYLRILRYFRFQSQLGFDTDDWYYHNIYDYLNYLVCISPERIREEFFKLIVGDHVLKIEPLIFISIIHELSPTIDFKQNCSHHKYSVYDHTIRGLGTLTEYKDPLLSFAFLMHDIAKPYCHSHENGIDHFYDHQIESERIADYVCDRLKFSTKDKKLIKFLVLHHMKLHQCYSKKSFRKVIQKCLDFDPQNGFEVARKLLKIAKADYSAMKPEFYKEYENIEEKMNEALHQASEMVSMPKSPLDGAEIMIEFRITEGKKVGVIKEFLRNLVIEGELAQDDKIGAIERVRQEYEFN